MNKMNIASRQLETDVCVVGAGMVGLSLALEARRRGLSVVVLEREDRAVGASVRNFGHLFTGSQPDGPVHELALRSRERWLELAARAGLGVVTEGTVIVARAEDELAVLQTATANPARAARMLSAAELRRLVPLESREIIGGLHSTLDLRVNPREAVGALAALLEDDPRADVLWGANVDAVAPGVVHAGRRVVRAPLIFVAPGPDFSALPSDLQPGLTGELTRCRLQMLRVASPAGRRFGPALATGYSLVRYPAFADQPETAALRARLTRERPELLADGIHLLITQLPGGEPGAAGDLIIGDSHAYGDTLEPFGEERIDGLLLTEAARLLDVDQLTVRERWHGIYATRSTTAAAGVTGYVPFHVTAPMDGVRVVENVAGIGMTLSLGYAAEVLDAAQSG